MSALSYRPEIHLEANFENLDYNQIAKECVNAHLATYLNKYVDRRVQKKRDANFTSSVCISLFFSFF